MSIVQPIPQPDLDTLPTAALARNLFRAYFAWLALLCLFLYLLPLALLKIPSFEAWGGSQFGPALDYDFLLNNKNADIVIFGDSAAVVGIDPSQLSRDLGVKVINIPNTAASLPILGKSVLRRYLAHNTRPRLLVFYFSPWNLNYTHQHSEALFEAEEILWRRGSLADIWSFIKTHPTDSLKYPLQFWRTNPDNVLLKIHHHENHTQELAATQGHFNLTLSPGSLPTPCTYTKAFLDDVPTDSVQSLIEEFAPRAQSTILVLAPLPACSNARSLLERDYSHLHAAAPVSMPPADFNNDGPYAHPLPFAVSAVTRSLEPLLHQALASH